MPWASETYVLTIVRGVGCGGHDIDESDPRAGVVVLYRMVLRVWDGDHDIVATMSSRCEQTGTATSDNHVSQVGASRLHRLNTRHSKTVQ